MPWSYTALPFSMYFTAHEAYKNGSNVYICSCGVVKYCANQNATPESVGVEFGSTV